ncbi:MAG: DNA-3-methyladenine glycosylase [Gemmatimonadota bacterium]|nr:DNA-3-methyladenine glycosylase [Gemmatimonadota bacterium]
MLTLHAPFDPASALAEISAADPEFGTAIGRVGPVVRHAARRGTPFQALLRSIVYQQLSGKAAATIHGRVCALFPQSTPTPEQTARLAPETLRAAGLSRAKTLAVHDLAARTLDGTVPTTTAGMRRLNEEEIIQRLTAVRGVGRWTVEMFLMFRLGRPDVLPATDLGIQKGFAVAFGKRKLPTPVQLLRRGERWRPWRTIASWYLWSLADLGPAE